MNRNQDTERILSALSRIEATQIVFNNKLVVVQAEIEEMKATIDGKPQTKEEFDANVVAITSEMQDMIKRTTKTFGNREVIQEAVSAQTQQLAQQNKEDIEGDKQTSDVHGQGPARSATTIVSHQIMTHRSLDDGEK